MRGPRAESRAAPLPPLLLPVLRRRRRELVGAARGTVLELGVVPDEGELAAVDAVSDVARVASLEEVDDATRFDTVVSCCALPAYADLPAACRFLAGCLDPSGRLLFVEPVSLPGLRGAVLGFGASILGATARLHLDRDVPSALRHNGLIVTEIERFTMPTMVGSLRHWVSGAAILASPSDRPGPLDEAAAGPTASTTVDGSPA